MLGKADGRGFSETVGTKMAIFGGGTHTQRG